MAISLAPGAQQAACTYMYMYWWLWLAVSHGAHAQHDYMYSVPSSQASIPPTVLWTSSPVHPDESVLATLTSTSTLRISLPLSRLFAHTKLMSPRGAGTSRPTHVELCQAPSAGRGRGDQVAAALSCVTNSSVHVLDGETAIFTVPKDWPIGAYQYRLCANCQEWHPVNVPDPWWAQADGGVSASPGGTLRIMGRSLAFDSERCASTLGAASDLGTAVRMKHQGAVVDLSVVSASCYDIIARLPLAGVSFGDHVVEVKNRFSDWVAVPGTVGVQMPHSYPTRQFSVMQQYSGDLKKALAAAGAAGGGTVTLPAGAHIKLGPRDQLVVPNNTQLVGAGIGEQRPTISWAAIDPTLSTPLVFGNGTFALVGLRFWRFDAINPTPVVAVGSGSVGASIRLVDVGSTQTPGAKLNINGSNALYVAGRGFSIVDSHFKQDGPLWPTTAPSADPRRLGASGPAPDPCGQPWPANCVMHLVSAEDGLFLRNNFSMDCQVSGSLLLSPAPPAVCLSFCRVRLGLLAFMHFVSLLPGVGRHELAPPHVRYKPIRCDWFQRVGRQWAGRTGLRLSKHPTQRSAPEYRHWQSRGLCISLRILH